MAEVGTIRSHQQTNKFFSVTEISNEIGFYVAFETIQLKWNKNKLGEYLF